ncbi:MAG: hypothetical protein A3C43_05750 [Candidatus Schekmanbacteria bacterium RIFCSPHIGHO2_02_FULL_38_11]|uniref:NADH dehydrogenase n=1 Tax=Candidatus Schekmanbacteria bacterium RIFCSPLOWO2_12_FULL_38_15 TaxID=1817883 RepID=A0A1F7SFU1_9BACT|nr:MAG: hypothetical protein A2043_11440 [Candidatus Schekmanbacteria bacterium GWA2_38_9]OGL49404.1 MAG: hypothetical protein A3H37_06925 [Candidatus Schekmanbacteria bacterium RIFCSPLOWO2_02_FULL_38_14]OGL52629.1 MAG: hypothetical protein A3G31_11750 [Candidatus Schekmanbacteria bacterium RIFCSPLOWO2_12_FULL_38_15]OGL55534.1 MAG: hypothetical protein A3C43_05750 [Candidatus Schekmanbacteria bacterium RIFCSPHIGHO2_02_FULL_38_11]
MPKLTIDGREIEVEQGTSILQVAERLGIFIPHFCYHKDLSWAGNCRMCQVEVEKAPKLVISCATVAAEGMVVHTKSEKVKKAIRGVMEFLLLNHPIDCPICDQAGECFLQDYYMSFALHDSRIEINDKLKKRKKIDLGNNIVLDTERCVLCSRCIRFCEEVTGTRELQFVKRGSKTEITTFFDKPIDNPYSGNLFEICPVGALTSRNFRFKCRVWFLKKIESVCPVCSTGCNIFICSTNKSMGSYPAGGVDDQIVHRFLSRYNPSVNRSWLCDEGRFSYKSINASNRLGNALRKAGDDLQTLEYGESLTMLHGNLKSIKEKYGPESIVAVASPQRTNEDIFLFRKYFKEVIKTPNILLGETSGRESALQMEDSLLRRKDKNPNTRGAIEIGVREIADSEKLLDIINQGKIKALYLMNSGIIAGRNGNERIKEALKKVEFAVTHATHMEEGLKYFNLILPVSTFAEREGTFTNYSGTVQKLNKALNPSADSKGDWEIIAELMKRMDYPLKTLKSEDVFCMLSEEVFSFKGMTYGNIGDSGMVLKSQEF